MSNQWDLTNPDERHLAAGEYVLGVLDKEQKTHFEALLAVSHDLQNDVDSWREHLQLFNEQLDPRTPPKEVWQRIIQATGAFPPPWWQRLGVWQTIAAGFGAVAIVFGTLWQQAELSTLPQGEAVFVVQDESRTPGWIISATTGGELIVQAVQPTQVSSNQTGELWLIAEGTPISLGLLPEQGNLRLHPSAELRAQLFNADLAVSIEPRGGAPDGQPTGPIIDHGRLVPMRGNTLNL
ncbi:MULTISPECIES: anti-sigma factor [Halomonadaceae]|uniref:Anti-sigma factor n=1 Tax=Vreelandella alkaliphila TaxID=272774 RepID=A0AAJ2S096_9GAMM|nr:MULTISPECIES: anti-sigma factor [Halomonas]MCD6005439.1 anti-sigma factor [Halomonas sp. IOP_6]MCD6438662.1 anti-sigma factor [Halomonas sp.]MDX5977453.1 anti-sigma factor [Halomonas alkaliphila]